MSLPNIMSEPKFRAPICAILGHVDAGKTLLLDRLRDTNVIAGESGGITQKIGCTFLTGSALDKIYNSGDTNGILLIDTPGHSCFTKQRMCGINASDMVIVVVDIFSGLQEQTIECIKRLRESKRPFVIAANKIDRIYEWKSVDNTNANEWRKAQTSDVRNRFRELTNNIIVQCAEQSINSALFYKNSDPKQFVSIIPVSAETGEGLGDLLMVVDKLVCKFLKSKITVHDDMRGWVIEIIKDKMNGKVCSIVLTDGMLKMNDVVCYTNENSGEIGKSKIKRILVPSESTEIKDTLNLDAVDQIQAPASIVIKFEDATPKIGSMIGDNLLDTLDAPHTHGKREAEEVHEAESESEFITPGVWINASSQGMAYGLHALCVEQNIPVAGYVIGMLKKADVYKMKYDNNTLFTAKYDALMAYGIEIPDGIADVLRSENVHMISNDIVYRIVDEYADYMKACNSRILNKYPELAECSAIIIEKYVFLKKNPLLFGVRVANDKLIKGVGLMATKDGKEIELGRVVSIQKESIDVEVANERDEVCIKIEGTKSEYGKDFDATWELRPRRNSEHRRLIRMYGPF